MKKTMLFAGMAALLMISSCQKEETPSQNSAKDLVFTATIENSSTKTTVDAVNAKVAWAMDDEITVTDNSSVSVKYTVTAIDGSGKATFTKKSGESGILGSGPYTAVYGTAPSASQTYSTSAPSLPMSGASGASDTNLKFTVTCGLLEITLTQEGESIKSISVSDNAETPNTYTLDCGTGVSIASSAKFYIAVPAGTYTSFQFTNGTDVVRGRNTSVTVEANHIKPMSSNFAPKYTSGTTDADYGIKVGSKWWAPVNCGYDATNYPYGLLYQWSRKYGQPYETNPEYIETAASDIAAGNTDANKDKFYKVSGCWYTGNSTSDTWDQTNYNPCPSGWKVPDIDEFGDLVYSDWDSSEHKAFNNNKRSYVWNSTNKTLTIDGLTLPAAGYRDDSSGNATYRNSVGLYWTSSPYNSDGHKAQNFLVNTSGASQSYQDRSKGFSVRCIMN